MPWRLSLEVTPAALRERFAADPDPNLGPWPRIGPGDPVALVRADDIARVTTARLGLDREAERPLATVPAGGIEGDVRLVGALRDRRCMVVADGLTWLPTDRDDRPTRLSRADGAPFALAGLWEPTPGGPAAAVLTTAAGPRLRPVAERVPVVLARDDEPIWLHYSHASELRPLLGPTATEELAVGQLDGDGDGAGDGDDP